MQEYWIERYMDDHLDTDLKKILSPFALADYEDEGMFWHLICDISLIS